ncbi:tyrosine-protein kinase, partial [Klebsiella pneumoniae]|nr:tyrosine-protein kinase [Klebsiella pneumoniae]
MIQVEQKQGNAILNSLSQMLPDSQPQSAPEIALLQSRMILGKTVDDLNLQVDIHRKYFPIVGRGIARILGEKDGSIEVGHLFLTNNANDSDPKIILTVKSENEYVLSIDGHEISGRVGNELKWNGVSFELNSINSEPGS